MEKVTIREIARIAEVSPTAVSFVINDKPGVSEQTRKRVKEVIRMMNFTPSVNSRRLFFKKSYNISIVIRQTSSPFDNLFYFEIARGLLTRSKNYGYNIVFTDVSIENGRIMLPDIIMQNDTDGIIFLQDTETAILKEIDKENIPYVVVDAHSTPEGITVVAADYELSSYTAVMHLITNGHRDIAFIGSSFIPEFHMQAFGGYKRALDEINASIPSSWIQTNAVDEVTSYNCMEKIIKSGHIPTAVFCSGDIFAIGAMKCIKDRGLGVPKDVSFTSIDDILLSRYFETKLTTIRIDMPAMGEIAMDLIIKKINGEPAESMIVESDNLVIRDSVRKI